MSVYPTTLPVIDYFVDANGTLVENHIPPRNPVESWIDSTSNYQIQSALIQHSTAFNRDMTIDNNVELQQVIVNCLLDWRNANVKSGGNIDFTGSTFPYGTGDWPFSQQSAVGPSLGTNAGIITDTSNTPFTQIRMKLNGTNLLCIIAIQVENDSGGSIDYSGSVTATYHKFVWNVETNNYEASTTHSADYDYIIRVPKAVITLNVNGVVADKIKLNSLVTLNSATQTQGALDRIGGGPNDGIVKSLIVFDWSINSNVFDSLIKLLTLSALRVSDDSLIGVVSLSGVGSTNAMSVLTAQEQSDISADPNKTEFSLSVISLTGTNNNKIIDSVSANGFWNSQPLPPNTQYEELLPA